MRRPRVLNRHVDKITSDAIYVGRGTPWGNPFSTSDGLSRWDCIVRHRKWLLSQPDLVARVKQELRGKDLVCSCYPKACHASTLLEVANGPAPVQKKDSLITDLLDSLPPEDLL